MKLTHLLALIPTALLLAGCDDAETQACRYYVQQDLDKGNFDAVINQLENDTSCQNDYTDNEYLVDLGAAYLGRSGMSITEVVSAMLEEDEQSSEDQFLVFLEQITNTANDSALSDLSKSREKYKEYLGNQECTDLINPTSTQDGICLMTGFVDVLKTTMAIDAMTGGDVASWIEEANGNGESKGDAAMLRSTCALEYSYEHKLGNTPAVPLTNPYPCSSDAFVDAVEPNVTFTSSNGVTKTFNSLTVSYNGENGYFLESETIGSTIFTQGYCANNYATRYDTYTECTNEETACYACPMDSEADAENDLNTQDFVLNALNSGFDSLESLVKDNDELLDSIEEFKQEIKPEGCDNIPNGEECFTLDDIIDYLNKQ